MKRSRLGFDCGTIAISVCLAMLSGCASLRSPEAGNALTPAQIAAIVSSPDRSEADRANDLRRKPELLLAFYGIRPGEVALDVSAAGGYTTELLARAVGPTGLVYGQSPPRNPGQTPPPPAAPEGNANPAAQASSAPSAPTPAAPRRPSPVALAERDSTLQAGRVPAARIVPVVQRFEDPVPPDRKFQGLDLVTLMFNYHDLGHMGVDRAQMNRALFAALKPGGRYIVADHAGRPGTGISESGTLHRIDEAFLIQEVEAAGFKLIEKGTFLRNPSDPRDRNTPDPPQPKDDFVVKFVRP